VKKTTKKSVLKAFKTIAVFFLGASATMVVAILIHHINPEIITPGNEIAAIFTLLVLAFVLGFIDKAA
jgi:hypothetical protein